MEVFSEAGPSRSRSRSSSLTPLPSSQEVAEEQARQSPQGEPQGQQSAAPSSDRLSEEREQPAIASSQRVPATPTHAPAPAPRRRRSTRDVSNPSKSLRPLTYDKERERKRAKREKQEQSKINTQEPANGPDHDDEGTTDTATGRPTARTSRAKKRKSDQIEHPSSAVEAGVSPKSNRDSSPSKRTTRAARRSTSVHRTKRPSTASREGSHAGSTQSSESPINNTHPSRKVICPSTPESPSKAARKTHVCGRATQADGAAAVGEQQIQSQGAIAHDVAQHEKYEDLKVQVVNTSQSDQLQGQKAKAVDEVHDRMLPGSGSQPGESPPELDHSHELQEQEQGQLETAAQHEDQDDRRASLDAALQERDVLESQAQDKAHAVPDVTATPKLSPAPSPSVCAGLEQQTMVQAGSTSHADQTTAPQSDPVDPAPLPHIEGLDATQRALATPPTIYERPEAPDEHESIEATPVEHAFPPPSQPPLSLQDVIEKDAILSSIGPSTRALEASPSSSSSLSIQLSHPLDHRVIPASQRFLHRNITDESISLPSSSPCPPAGLRHDFRLSPITSSSQRGNDSLLHRDDVSTEQDGSQILQELHAIADECSQPCAWQAPEQRRDVDVIAHSTEPMQGGAMDEDASRRTAQHNVHDEPAQAVEGEARVVAFLGDICQVDPPPLSPTHPHAEEGHAQVDQTLVGTAEQDPLQVGGTARHEPHIAVVPGVDASDVADEPAPEATSSPQATAHSAFAPDAVVAHDPSSKDCLTHSADGDETVLASDEQAGSPQSDHTLQHPPKPADEETQDLFSGFDSIDFGAVQLSPASARVSAGAEQKRQGSPEPVESPAREGSLKRHFSRVSTNRSEFDLEDDKFWEEAFESEHQPPLNLRAHALGDGPAETHHDAHNEHDDILPLSSSQLDEEVGLHEERHSSPPLPQAPPPGAFLGFSTGANKKLAEPSKAAMQQAMKRYAQDDVSGSAEGDIRRLAAVAAAKRRSAAAQQQQQQQQHKAKSPAVVLPAPPKAAHGPLSTVASQHTHPAIESDEDAAADYEAEPEPAVIPQFVSFAKANGKALEVSKAALDKASRQMDTWEAEHSSQVARAQQTAQPPSTPLGRSSTPASAQPASSRTALGPLPTSSAQFNRTVDLDSSAQNGMSGSHSSAQGSVSRASTASPVKAVQHVQQTPARQVSPSLRSRPSHVRPDQRASRISLGMTPRSKPGPGAAGKAPFKTPFKTPFRASPRPVLATSPTSPAVLQSRALSPSEITTTGSAALRDMHTPSPQETGQQ